MKNRLLILFGLWLGIVSGVAVSSAAAPKSFSGGESRLQLTAQIYEGREDEERTPVAARFYLFNHSVVAILKSRNFQPVDENDHPLTDETAYLEALVSLMVGEEANNRSDEETTLLRLLVNDAVAENRLAVIHTDEGGRSAAKSVPAGNYYLFGFASFNGEIFIWNLPVSVAEDTNLLEIDQYNADAVMGDRRLFYPTPYFDPENQAVITTRRDRCHLDLRTEFSCVKQFDKLGS